ncbi:MAG: lipopolysaccharide biosynthesis protein [Chitinophagaceae bacterium]
MIRFSDYFKDTVSIKTIKSISTLMTGNILAVIIPIVTAPISSRIFNSSDYGILGLYISINGLINVIGYAHYQHAILLESEPDGAKRYLWFTLGFCAVISVLTGLILLLLAISSSVIPNSVIGNWIWFLPLSVLCNGVSGCFLLWANRNQEYKVLSSNRVIQALLTVIVQLAIGLLIQNESGLMYGFIFGQVLSAFLLLRKFCNQSSHGVGFPVFKSIRQMAIKYKGLLFYSAPSEFINTLINQAPVFLLNKFAGVAYVGSFNFTQRLLGVPQMLLSSSIVEVFRQKAAFEYNNNGNCRPLFIKTFKVLTIIAIGPLLVMMFFSHEIFDFVFGSQWREAGELARILSILFFFRFIISPLTYVYTIASRFKEDFAMHIFLLIAIGLSFMIGYYFSLTNHQLLLSYTLAYSFCYFIYLYRSFKLSKIEHR